MCCHWDLWPYEVHIEEWDMHVNTTYLQVGVAGEGFSKSTDSLSFNTILRHGDLDQWPHSLSMKTCVLAVGDNWTTAHLKYFRQRLGPSIFQSISSSNKHLQSKLFSCILGLLVTLKQCLSKELVMGGGGGVVFIMTGQKGVYQLTVPPLIPKPLLLNLSTLME